MTDEHPDHDEHTGELAAEDTAAGKILQTLREMSQPDPGANAMQLTIASVAMGMESTMGEEIWRYQETGEVDEFVLNMTRFLASHRSKNARQLIVVEIPRRQLPSGTRLHLLDQAIEAAQTASSPF